MNLCLLAPLALAPLAPAGDAPPITAEAAYDRLELLAGDALAQAWSPQGGGAPAAPWSWPTEREPELRHSVSSVMPILESLHELLRDCEPWLQSNQRPASREPHLGRTRNLVNLLSGEALLAARESDWPQAAKSLATALDLCFFIDDGTTAGYLVRACLEVIALEALRWLSSETGIDAARIRRELDPRLRRAAMRTRLVQGAALLLEDARGGAPYILGEAEDIERGYERVSAGYDPCDVLPAERGRSIEHLPFFLSAAHTQHVRLHVARLALALLEQRQATGRWAESVQELEARYPDLPPCPCPRRTVEIEIGPSEVVLAARQDVWIPESGSISDANLRWRWRR